MFIGGFVRRHEGITNPIVLELLAIKEALSRLKERNKSCYIIESECLLAVN